MSNLSTALYSSASALKTYEKAMEVVQNDTVNASTPGYVRQTPVFEASTFDLNTAQAGGVSLAGTLSARDEYAEHNVQTQQSALGMSSVVVSKLSAIEPVFDLQSNTGVAANLNTLFGALSQLTVSPNNAQARQSVITAASGLAGAFQTTSQTLASASANIDSDLANTVQDINNIVADIQKVNTAIRAQYTNSQDPGLDARLHVDLEQLSQYADISTVRVQDGSLTVLLGGQRPLLVGTTQFTLSAVPNSNQSSILDSDGNDVTAFVRGGQLGGLLDVKNSKLSGYQTQLDQLASGIADTINTQLANGVDQNGNPGAPLFTYNTASAAKSLAVSSTLTTAQIAAAATTDDGLGNGNAQASSNLQNTTIPSLGGATFTQFYSSIATVIGQDISGAQDEQTTQQQLLDQAKSLRSDSSAVSLDEEAARLIEYQRAYQATSKLFTVIDSILQTVIGLIPS